MIGIVYWRDRTADLSISGSARGFTLSEPWERLNAPDLCSRKVVYQTTQLVKFFWTTKTKCFIIVNGQE